MQYEDYPYVDTAFGGPQRRNNVLSTAVIKDRLPDNKTDCYATWHRFPDAYLTHCQTTGSTGGYPGPSYADFLPFDFDGEDLSVVLGQVKDFLKMLEVTYEVDGLHGVRCYFSGKKGFHILLSSHLFGGWTPSPNLHRHLQGLAKSIAQDAGADLSIYDQNRLLRLSNSKHSDSGLWKIPLETREVLALSIDAITEMAAQGPREIEFPSWEDVETAEPCKALLQDAAIQKPQKTLKIAKPVELFPTGMKEGDGRDNQAFTIARYCRDRKMERSAALGILQLWDGQQADAMGQRLLEQKIQSAYGRAAAGDVEDDITPDDIKTPSELAAEYDTYIEKLKSHRISLGWPEVDARLRGIAPGEVLTIIAKSGVGKTAVLQNILRHIALSQDSVSLFCSLEQPLAQVFERFAQMGSGEAGEDIESSWQDPSERERITTTVMDDLGDQVLTCGRGGLRLEQLHQALDAAEEKIGSPVHVLAIDYLGLLDTSDLEKSLYGQISRAARELKNLAKRRDLAVICLCQVSRAGGEDGSSPLTIHSARESGAIEESADFLLGLYRPDLHEEDKTIAVQILKNRKGQHGIEFTHDFDKISLRVVAPRLKLIDGKQEQMRHEF
jgi:hypothetical protein